MIQARASGESWSDTAIKALSDGLVALQRKVRVLIAEDDKADADYLVQLLKEFPCEVEFCDTFPICKELVCVKDFDVVFLDLKLPSGSGFDLLESAISCFRRAKFIIVTGFSDSFIVERALQLGTVAVLVKPVKREDLQSIFSQLNAHGRKSTG